MKGLKPFTNFKYLSQLECAWAETQAGHSLNGFSVSVFRGEIDIIDVDNEIGRATIKYKWRCKKNKTRWEEVRHADYLNQQFNDHTMMQIKEHNGSYVVIEEGAGDALGICRPLDAQAITIVRFDRLTKKEILKKPITDIDYILKEIMLTDLQG